MAGPAASPRIERCAYPSTARARLPGNRPAVSALRAAALLLLIAAAAGGCSISPQLGALDKNGGDTTGLIGHTALGASDLSAGDLQFARAAAAEVLSRGKTTSLPWENPRTGAHGMVTPIASAYEQNGTICRDFLASYSRAAEEAWLQGAACRAGGRWEVRSLTPRQGS